MLRFAGHTYRVAQEPIQQQVDEQFGEGAYEAIYAASLELLQRTGVQPEGAPEPVQEIEADGIDLIYNLKIPNLPSLAKLTLDFTSVDEKATPQEAILEMCNVGYGAVKPDTLVELLKAVATLQKLSPPVQLPKTNKEQAKARDWLEHYLPGILMEMQKALTIQQGEAITDIGIENQQVFAKTLTELLKGEATAKAFSTPENAHNAIEMVGMLDSAQWQLLVKTILATRGKAFPTRELVAKKVTELTAHEQYSGEIQILGYVADRVAVGVQVPPPLEGMLFVFRRPPGTNDIQLVDAGIVLCGNRALTTGADETLAKLMVTAMVDLTLASDVAANPEYSQPPGEEGEEGAQLSLKALNKELSKGLALWYSGSGYIRMVLKGGEDTGVCYSHEELLEDIEKDESTLKNWLRSVKLAGGRVFKIEEDGAVHLMNYQMQIIQRDVASVSDPGKMQCSG